MLNANHLIGFGAAQAGDGPITFVNSAQTQNASAGTSISISTPSAVAVGDLLVALLSSEGNCHPWNQPTGWTLVTDSTYRDMALIWRVADGSEGSSLAFTCTNSYRLSGTVVAYRNAAFDVLGAYATENDDPVVAPQITVSFANSLLMAFYRRRASSITFSVPSGMSTVATDADATNPSWRVFSEAVGAGATGTRSSSGSTPNSVSGFLFSLNNA